MTTLAPNIVRQRLLIEGFYKIDVGKDEIKEYLFGVAKALNLRTYGEPTIFSPAGMGKEENQGYDAFIPLIDSGITMYVWSNEKFLSIVLYTCKNFDEDEALHYTKDFFKLTGETQTLSF